MNDTPYCSRCEKRENCDVLCAPVQDLLDKVVAKKKRLPRDFVQQVKHDYEKWPETGKSKAQLIRELYFLDGRKYQDIAYLVNCNRHYVSKVVRREKRKKLCKNHP